ncbi:MAG: hypothetical protein ABII82_16720 [Verrucomicrobiota bacterium]
MKTPADIERLQARVDRLEHELQAVRVELAAFQVDAPVEPPPLPVASAPVADPVVEEAFVAPSPLPAEVVEKWAPEVPPPSPLAVESSGPDWRDWLRSLQLWPPAGEGSAEVRLGAWWATRVGALLAVIGVVFFGVYVSVGTPPWVKFLELLAVALGVTAGGFWLERKVERFGAVVAAGGLALIYFCAFAAHAVPAVRVLASPLAAGGWQLAAVALILGAALWRRSSVIATLAVGLGAATALFALTGGFSGFALFTVGLLAVVAVAFARLRGWEATSVLALPAVHAVYLSVWADQWRGGGAPAGGLPWWFLGGVTLVFFLRDWRGHRVESAAVSRGEQWFQGANSSLAALSGVVTALTLYRAELAWFYLGAAGLFAAMAAVRRRQVAGDVVEVLLTAKATGALTLGVIELTAGRTTALALLVQAAVLAWLAPRLASRLLAAAAGLVATVAAGFMFKDAVGGAYWLEAAGPVGLFLGGWLWLAATEPGRWLTASTARFFEVAAGVAGGLLAMAAAGGWWPSEWAPAWLAGLALVMAAPVVWRRSVVFMVAGGLALAAAQCWLWQRAWSGQPELWLNAVAVLSPLAVAAWVLGGRETWRGVGFAGLLTALFGLAQVARAELPGEWAVSGCVAVGAVLAGLAPWTGERRWQAAGTVLAGLGVWQTWTNAPEVGVVWTVMVVGGLWILPVILHESSRHRAQARGGDRWVRPAQLGVAAAGTFVLLPAVTSTATEVLIWAGLGVGLCALRTWRGLPGSLAAGLVAWVVATWRLDDVAFGVATGGLLAAVAAGWAVVAWLREDESRWGRVGAAVLATLFTMQVATVALRGSDRLWVIAAVVCGVAALGRWLNVRAARPAALVLSAWGWGQAIWLIGGGRALGWGEPAAAVLVFALVLIALPVWLARAGDELAAGTRGGVRWLCGLAGVLVAGALVWRQPPPLAAYVTVGWGLIAITIFAVGLLGRLRSHRLLGLLVLAVCVPRVFVVDLDSMLHRIVAFIALGVVLLWVGFSYHRFRHWISGETPEHKESLNHE